MTYHAMSGKLVGLGQNLEVNFPINEQTVAFLAAVPCENYAAVKTLTPSMVQLLAATFTGTPPPGVTKQSLDAFTLRAIQCDLYSRPHAPEVHAWLTAAFPLPSCLDTDTIRLLGYKDRSGYQGDDPEKNMVAWLLIRNQMYEYALRRTPPCPGSCHNEYHAKIVVDCMSNPGDSLCTASPAIQQWYEDNVTKKLCPTYGGKVRAAIDAAPCDGLPFLSYCAEYGYKGPDPSKNAGCWSLWAAGRMDSAIDRCGLRAAPAPAPVPAPPPVTEAPEATEQPLFAESTPTMFGPSVEQPPPTFGPPVEEPAPDMWSSPPLPEPEPEPEKRMSTATLGILGILGVAAVGGVVYAARKKKKGG